MTTNHAIATIKTIAKHAIDRKLLPVLDIVDAAATAVEALLAPSPWICTADQRPTLEDASYTGMVLAYKAASKAVTVVKWGYCTPKAYPWWMPYPTSPQEVFHD